MSATRFIKSFSKGQITIPKEFRDMFGIGDEFWLKLPIEEGKLIAEPVEHISSQNDYPQKLLRIKGTWFPVEENKEIRNEIEKRLDQTSL